MTPPIRARLYVAYTDSIPPALLCGVRLAMRSSAPATAGRLVVAYGRQRDLLDSTGAVQGSQVAVGSGGEVYVAYESFDAFDNPQIEVARSNDQAQLTTPLVVATVNGRRRASIFGNGERPFKAASTATSFRAW